MRVVLVWQSGQGRLGVVEATETIKEQDEAQVPTISRPAGKGRNGEASIARHPLGRTSAALAVIASEYTSF
jgi:hypothetical protein